MSRLHAEKHQVSRIGWLRAAVLGANDGIVSTASLIIGVAAASTGRIEVLIAGLAGLVAGAMSMAAGEYVSVSSQSDTERADLAREKWELETSPHAEHAELATIYRQETPVQIPESASRPGWAANPPRNERPKEDSSAPRSRLRQGNSRYGRDPADGKGRTGSPCAR